MTMISRCYLEITNVCNLDCVFCPKMDRPKHRLTQEEFDHLTDKLQGQVQFLYFHLMGEPFLHPLLPDFIQSARQKGFVPVLTTNGTLLPKTRGVIEAHPHKIQISLHSQEGNGKENPEAYLEGVMKFALEAASAGYSRGVGQLLSPSVDFASRWMEVGGESLSGVRPYV